MLAQPFAFAFTFTSAFPRLAQANDIEDIKEDMSDLMAVLDNTDTELKREKEKVAVAKENLLIQEVEEQGKEVRVVLSAAEGG